MKNYNANASLKAANVQVNFTADQIQEYIKCSSDPVYFIKNYCKIISLDHGLIPFELFEYQCRFINAIHTNNRIVSMQPRQMGKSQTVAAYILYYTLFNPHKTVAILANKASAAREIMSRYQLMYEELPMWLQQGVVTWNKGDVELENGAKVFTAATSGSGIRGKSCVTGDTKVCIAENDTIWYTKISNIISGYYNSDQNNRKAAVVYKTTNRINGDSFVGIRLIDLSRIRSFPTSDASCFTDGYLGHGTELIESIEMHGPEIFKQEICDIFGTIEDAALKYPIQVNDRVANTVSAKILSS
ncbi:MAG: terminase large subunit domain-containing protein, partial [Prevotella sp.]